MIRNAFSSPLAASLLVLNSSAAVLATEPLHWQQTDYIENSFYTIALEREHSPNSPATLSKWHSPILFYIDDRTEDKSLHSRMVNQHMQHLATISGLSVNPTNQLAKANLRIIFSGETTLDRDLSRDLGINNPNLHQQLLTDSVCLGRLTVADDGYIKDATVLIPVDRARAHGKLMACVVEELTQVLGLVNDSTAVYPSIFNDRSFNDFLSGLDYLLLKLLYHPDLKAGMNKQQLQPLVANILPTEAFQSLIHDAQRDVQTGSLENWLD
jgi:hypothetical protein